MDHLCGARIDPAETELVHDYLRALGLPVSAAAADPSLIGYREGETVLLWDAEQNLFGKLLKSWIQTFGCCVGMGFGRAMQDAIYNAVAFGNQLWKEPVSVAWEPAYGGSRTAADIGNGRMGADPDGNYPPWMARWFHDYGVSVRKQYGAYDLTRQREDLAAQWCAKGHAVPQQIVAESKPFKSQACYWPESVDEILGCIRAKYGVARAADRATRAARDSRGVSGLVKSGGHCECWRGVVVMKDGTTMVAEQQSWPENAAPHGQYRLTDISGKDIELPQGVGLIPLEDVEYCLKQGEVVAVAPPFDLKWSTQ